MLTYKLKLSKDLAKIVDEGGYITQKIFNLDQTATGCKMPSRIFPAQVKSIPVLKGQADSYRDQYT